MTDPAHATVREPPDSGALTQLEIVWMEPPAALRSFPLDHPYVELVYAPLVGASAVLFVRRIALLAIGRDSVVVDRAVIASELGLRSRTDGEVGRNSPLIKALNRLTHYRLARWFRADRFGVYQQAPAVAGEDLARLPASTRQVHARYLQRKA